VTRRVPTAFRELTTDHLECRSWSHAWSHVSTHVRRDDIGRAFDVTLECLRCHTLRHDVIDAGSGELDGRAYTHADGYLIDDVPSWGGRATFNANARRELYRRLTTPRPRGG